MLNITRTSTCSRFIEEGGPIDRERTSRRGIFRHWGWSYTTEASCRRTNTSAIRSRGCGSRAGAGGAGCLGFSLFGLFGLGIGLLVLVFALFGGDGDIRCCPYFGRRRRRSYGTTT